jgi:serine/threonine-protein kinase
MSESDPKSPTRAPTSPRDPRRAPHPGRPRGDTSRNLLFGLLAFQNNFIDRDALLAAFDAWVVDRSRGLGQVLLERGALSPGRRTILEALVEEHIRLHDDDPEKSLASVGPVGSLGDDLSRSTDPEVRSSLSRLRAEGDGHREDTERTFTWPHSADPAGPGPRFRIIRPHARGGLGEVFIALDTELNRDVALKEIQADIADNPSYRSRFEFEAKVTGGLEHPGIVPVYGLGHTPDGRPYYAMRFIKGESLKVAVRRFHDDEHRERRGRGRGRGRGRTNLALRELLGRFMDVCDAVAYAHSRGVLHRDLKPSNIMLGKYGETLVVDWGLAKALGRPEADEDIVRSEMPLTPATGLALEPTMDGSAVGTPGYMSPEQAAGRVGEMGIRSDVYCLGATLYHLLTGHAPCEAADRAEAHRKALAGDIRRPRVLNPGIPKPLEAVCLKAIARAPADRYDSAEALKADLERWLADEPVLAYPEPWPARAMRWVRRNRSPVAAAAGLMLMATLGLAIHDWQLGREKARTADLLRMTGDAMSEQLSFAGMSLADIPNTERLRQDLAELALAQCEKLARAFPDAPQVRLQTAQTHRVIGGIGRLTGRFAESDRSYEQAINLLSALCDEDPAGFEYRQWLVEALHERGELFHMNGRVREAERWINRAIAQSESLRIRPIGPIYRRARGTALSDLSEVLALQGRPQEAREKAGQAVELLERNARDDAGSGAGPPGLNRWLLTLALVARGTAARDAGDDRAAARDLDEAEAVAGPVPSDDPFHDDLQFQLARIDRLRGEAIGRGPAAPEVLESALARASQRLNDLIAKNKLMPQYDEEMAATLSARAAIRLARQRPAEAEADCRAAIARLQRLIDDRATRHAPVHPGYLGLRGRAHLLAARIHDEQGRRQDARLARDKGAADLREAFHIDDTRGQDAKALDLLKAEADRAPVGVGHVPEGD